MSNPETAATLASIVAGLIVGLAAWWKGKDKSGIASATATKTPQAVVNALASGSSEAVIINVGATLVALAQTIADQTSRLEASEGRIEVLERRNATLERREARHQARQAELEAWGTWAADPPPRKVPPWNPPETEPLK